MSLRTLALVALTAAACASEPDEQSARFAQRSAALVAAPPVDQFAVYAANSVAVGNAARVVGGHVGVARVATASAGGALQDGVRASFGAWSDIASGSEHNVYAHTLIFEDGSRMKRAFYSLGYLTQNVTGTRKPISSLSMPAFPRSLGAQPGSVDVDVAPGVVHSLSSGGSFGVVTVTGTLALGAGDFHFARLTLTSSAALRASGATRVFVAERVQLGARARVVSTTPASPVQLFVLGSNGYPGGPNSRPPAVLLGNDTRSDVVLLAPSGTVHLAARATVRGALVARDVRLGDQSSVTFVGGLTTPTGLPSTTPDVYAAVEDRALVIPSGAGPLANDVGAAYGPLNLALVTLPSHGTLTTTQSGSQAGAFTYVPHADYAGTDSFDYRAIDPTNSASSAVTRVTITVSAVNDVPALVGRPTQRIFVGQSWSFVPAVVDPDFGDVHTYTIEQGPSGFIFSGSAFFWSPTAAQVGTHAVSVAVTDAAGARDTQSFQLQVEARPHAEDFVMLAQNSIHILGHAVKGAVGVIDTGSPSSALLSSHRVVLDFNATAGAAPGADIHAASARLRVGSQAQVLFVPSSSVLVESNATHQGLAAPVPLPTLSGLATAATSTRTLDVPAGQSLALGANSVHGPVTVRAGATLRLAAGDHAMGSLTLENNANVVADGDLRLVVHGFVDVGTNAYIGPGMTQGGREARLSLHIHAVSPATFALRTGGWSSVTGHILAPTGLVDLGQSSVNWARIEARDIRAAQGSITYLDGRPTPNQPPHIVSSPGLFARVGEPYRYAVSVEDPDQGDVVSLSASIGGASVPVDQLSRVLNFTPGAQHVGAQLVTLVATDSSGATDTQTFTLTVSGAGSSADAGVSDAAALDAQSPDAPAPDATALDAAAPDADEPTDAGAPPSDAGGSPDASAPSDAQPPADATSPAPDAAPADTGVPPNTAPTISTSPLLVVVQSQLYRYDADASDPDQGDTVSFSLRTAPTGMSVDPSSGVVTWTPSPTQVAPTSVELVARDAQGAENTQSFVVTVVNINDPPAFTSTPSPTGAEGQAYAYTLSATDPDPNDSLRFGVRGPGTLSGNLFTWTPSPDEVGPRTIVFTVSDGQVTVEQQVTVQVADVPVPPRFIQVPLVPVTLAEDRPFTLALRADDPDLNEVLTYQVDVGPPGLTVDAEGLVRWTPTNPGFSPLVVRVTDLAGTFDLASISLVVANVNDPPVMTSTAAPFPGTVRVGETFTFTLTATDADARDVLRFQLDAPPLGLALDASSGAITWIPSATQVGSWVIAARAVDAAGAPSAPVRLPVTVLPQRAGTAACAANPAAAGCAALGFGHVVERSSIPLGAVQAQPLAPAAPTVRTSAVGGGLLLFGDGTPGVEQVRLTTSGYVDAWARAELIAGETRWVPVPRLVPISDLRRTVTATGATLALRGSPDQAPSAYPLGAPRTALSFPAGAFITSPATVDLALLDAQSLPSYLPPGYSPIGGAHYTSDALLGPGVRPTLALPVPAPIPSGARVIAARWEPSQVAWARIDDPTTLDAQTLQLSIGAPGAYLALVVDAEVALAAVGQPLAPSPLAEPSPAEREALAANGNVEPETQVIGASPEARDMTAEARMTVVFAPRPLPSGVVLPASLDETYAFVDGRSAQVEAAVLSVALYRYPTTDATASPPGSPDPLATHRLSARFPLRPRHLLGERLAADVHQTLTLASDLSFEGLILDGSGGFVAAGDVALAVPPSSAPGDRALARLSPIDTTGLRAGAFQARLAFQLELVGDLLSPTAAPLALRAAGLPPSARFVLARREISTLAEGWTPVERLHTTATGDLVSDESGPIRLPGLVAAGTYALFPVDQPQGAIVGRALDAAGALVRDALVESPGRPWISVTRTGRYALVAPLTTVDVAARRPTGDAATGRATVTLASNTLTVEQDLVIAPAAPWVAATTPRTVDESSSETAPLASRLTPIEVTFSEPMSASIDGPDALRVYELGDTTEVRVEGTLTTREGRRGLRFLPTRPLRAARTYRLVVTSSATDAQGVALDPARPRSFRFATPATSAAGVLAARLMSWGPGLPGTPCEGNANTPAVPGFDPRRSDTICVLGGAGVADAAAPVILVNDVTGANYTVTAGPDGSFRGYVRAREEETVSAYLTALDGSQLRVPLERQFLSNDRVGLFSGGGVLTAPNPLGSNLAPLEVIVEPGTIRTRGVFRVTGATPSDVLAASNGAVPSFDGHTYPIIVGARVAYEGPPLDRSLDVTYPIDPSTLPSGFDPAGFILVRPTQVNLTGEPVDVFDTADRMRYDPATQSLSTHSYPMDGAVADPDYPFIYAAMMVERVPVAIHGYAVACSLPNGAICTGDQRFEIGRALQTVQPTDLDRQLLALDARALPGAIVQAGQLGESTGRLFNLGGGSIVSVARRDGKYSLALPGMQHATAEVFARHPSQRNAAATGLTDFGLARVANLVFDGDQRTGVHLGPAVSVDHSPPGPGLLGNLSLSAAPDSDRALITVVATSTLATIENLVIQEVVPLDITQQVGIGDVQVSSIGQRRTVSSVERAFRMGIRAPARVRFMARAHNAAGSRRQIYTITFGAPPSPAETEEMHPFEPLVPSNFTVVATTPETSASCSSQGAGHPVDQPIRVVFNQPVLRASARTPGMFSLDGLASEPAVRISPDAREVELRFPDLEADHTYTLTVRGLTSRTSHQFDQEPEQPGRQSFQLCFRTRAYIDFANQAFQREASGHESIVHGRYLFVRDDHGAENGALALGGVLVYDLQDPRSPRLVNTIRGLRSPRGMVLVPNYDFYTVGSVCPPGGQAWTPPIPTPAPPTPLGPGCILRNRTLLAVLGGGVGSESNQYLTVLDVSDPETPFRISSGQLNLEPLSALRDLRWSAPFLAFHELGFSSDSIALVDLQAHIIARTTGPIERDARENLTMIPGLDLNGDGDYVDIVEGQSETPPIPPRPMFGEIMDVLARARVNAALGDQGQYALTSQRLIDFTVHGPAQFVGAIVSRGEFLNADGAPSPGGPTEPLSFNTLYAAGPLPPRAASFVLSPPTGPVPGGVRDASRLLYVPRVRLVTSRQQPAELVDLVVIAVELEAPAGTPAARGLVLLDVTDPMAPRQVGPVPALTLPSTLGARSLGQIVRLELDPLVPETLRVVTDAGVLNLDIPLMGLPSLPPPHPHEAFSGSLPGLATQEGAFSTGGTEMGLFVLRDEATIRFTGPRLEWVRFAGGPVVDSTQFANSPDMWHTLSPRRQRVRTLDPARIRGLSSVPESILNGDYNYHVLVHAPGGLASTLPLIAASVDAARRPLPNTTGCLAPTLRAPHPMLADIERTATGGQTPIPGELKARRASNEPIDRLFNLFVSDPVALTAEVLSPGTCAQQRTVGQAEHVLLASSDAIRVAIARTGIPLLAQAESSVVDRRLVVAGPLDAPTRRTSRVSPSAPTPVSGPTPFRLSKGHVSAQTAELLETATDLVLPTSGPPLALTRTYRGRDAILPGAFGPGFDFDLGMHITPHRTTNCEAPVVAVERAGGDHSVARCNDVVFHNGRGAQVVYQRRSPTPVVYENDELLQVDGLIRSDATYYLPEDGIFDALVYVPGNGYALVTPAGDRFEFDPEGRLRASTNRFRQDIQTLDYTAGRLRAVRHTQARASSTNSARPRAMLFGYYLPLNDPDYRRTVDVVAPDPNVEGLIAAIYDDRRPGEPMVKYQYDDDGFLTHVGGVPMVTGDDSSRATTEYRWRDGRVVEVLKPDTGGIGTLQTTPGLDGQISSCSSYGVGFQSIAPGRAQSLEGTVELFDFDPFGNVVRIERRDALGGTYVSTYGYTQRHLIEQVREPGRAPVHITYASSAQNHRSRGNVVEVQRDGRPVLSVTYDARFNIPTSVQDATRNITSYTIPALAAAPTQVTHVGGGAQYTESFVHDEHGRVLSHVDPDGILRTYTYNDASVESVQLGSSSNTVTRFTTQGCNGSHWALPCTERRPGVPQIDFSYNARGDLLRSHQAGGLDVQRVVSPQGRITHIEQTYGGSAADVVSETFQLDDQGRTVESVVTPVEADGGTTRLETTYRYDRDGNLASLRRPDHVVTTYTYDGLGRPLTQQTVGRTTRFVYHPSGQLRLTLIDNIPVQERTFDALGRVTGVHVPAVGQGPATLITYDASDRPEDITVVDAGFSAPERRHHIDQRDPLGRPTSWTEDGTRFSATFGPRVQTLTLDLRAGRSGAGASAETTTTNFDDSGRVTSRSNALAQQTWTYHPTHPFFVDYERSDEPGQTFETTFEPDALGRLQTVLTQGVPRVRLDRRLDGAVTRTTVDPAQLALRVDHSVSSLGENLGQVSLTSTTAVGSRLVLDAARRTVSEGPASGSFTNSRRFEYDTLDRLGRIVEREGLTWTAGPFDRFDLPTQLESPGGLTYRRVLDSAGRLTEDTASGGAPSLVLTRTPDALDRAMRLGEAGRQIDRVFDLRGTELSTTLTGNTQPFSLGRTAEEDGAPRTLTYADGTVVTYGRSAFGRLETVRIGSADTPYSVNAYAQATVPGDVSLGGQGLRRHDTYDARRRLVARSYAFTPLQSGVPSSTIAAFRYVYDGADRETGRQDLHRGGRTQLVAYDEASRVIAFDADAVPSFVLGDATNRPAWTPILPGFRQGRYQRRLAYDGRGLDHLVSANTHTATRAPAGLGLATGAFNPSALGFITQTQAGTRSRSNRGLARTIPSLLGGQLTLDHDQRGRLTGISHSDGRTVTYTYRPDGVLLARDLSCPLGHPSCQPRTTTFIYDGLRLLEQREASGLSFRFLYADDLDVPFAVERSGFIVGQTERAFFVHDRNGSTLGLLDAGGQWIEHTTYDLWGWPTYTGPDNLAPDLDVLSRDGRDVIVAFTEPVLPALQAATPLASAFRGLQPLADAFALVDTSTGGDVPVVARLRDRAPGHEVVLTPRSPLVVGRTYQLFARPGRVIDAHGNALDHAQPLGVFTWSAVNADLIHRNRGPQATAAVVAPSSPFGHLLGFQSHLVDPDMGLIHMRGRVFDPHTGTFLELDPAGLADSTNPYAGFAHDTINHRDPTGEVANFLIAAVVLGLAVGAENDSQVDLTPIVVNAAGTGAGLALARAGSPLLGLAADGAVSGLLGRGVEDAKAGQLSGIEDYLWSAETGMLFGVGGALAGKATGLVLRAGLRGLQAATLAAHLELGPVSRVGNFGATAIESVMPPCTGPLCPGGKCFVTGTPVDTPDGLTPIESLQVGDHVVAHAPCEDPEVTDDWRVLSLRLDDDRGPAFAVEVDTLVPPDLAAEAQATGVRPLVLHELGIQGLARVLDVRPPPALSSGPGCLVRSTVTSWSAKVLALRFAETDEVLEPTEAHPLFRVEDGAWVRAGDLRVGDHLRTADGTVTVTRVEPQAAFRQVHNLEVDQQHTYYTLASRILAHNTYGDTSAGDRIALGLTSVRPDGGLKGHGYRSNAFSETLLAKFARHVNAKHYRQWQGAAQVSDDPSILLPWIRQQMENASEIHFNLDRLSAKLFARESGAIGPSMSITNWELKLILDNPSQFIHKTTFYDPSSKLAKMLPADAQIIRTR